MWKRSAAVRIQSYLGMTGIALILLLKRCSAQSNSAVSVFCRQHNVVI